MKQALRNGVLEDMAYALAVASTPYILIRNDYQAAFRYCQYAIQVAAGNKRALGNAKHILVLVSWHWCNPIKDDTALEIAWDAHHLLIQGGDIQMAGYTLYDTVSYLWERGDPLDRVLAEAEKAMEFNRKTQNLHGTAVVYPYSQIVKTLMAEEGEYLTFCREGFSEDDFIRQNQANAMGLCFLHIFKMQTAYLFGDVEKAYELGLEAEKRFIFITSFLAAQTGLFYLGLSACAVLNPADKKWETVTRARDQMQQWSQGAPENFKHKLHLLEAEIARKQKDIALAVRCYMQALLAARQNRFLHENALICERFSSFWEEQDNAELAEYYAKEAFHAYELWGAKRKCAQLRSRHHTVYFESQFQDLDLLSVINAQNILAQETNIEKLLKQMMQVLLEVSGAERGFLILKDTQWAVEAFKNTRGEEFYLESRPLSRDMLSVDMVNYVIRTGQSARIDQFSIHLEDDYLNRVKPQSLIILPAVVSSRTIAVIYLEHTRIKNMFSLNKQETIKLLSTQIAISLNNAKIYNQLEQRVQERTRKLAAQNEALAIARKKAEQANAAKSEFLSNMSHELRTPLNAVTGFSELLTTMVSDPRQKSYLEAIKTSGRNLLTLINDILDLSKIEAGKIAITYAPVKLETIFMEIQQIFKIKCEVKKLTFLTHLSTDLPDWLYLDEIRIRQILFNLVGNAVKFTQTGGVTLSAGFMGKERGKGRLTISVEDTGIGISKEEQDNVFKAFEQADKHDTAKYGGTGLGLAITRRLVELMDGQIFVSSTMGKGSRFDVEFAVVGIASSFSEAFETNTLSFENIAFDPVKVLVVDDVESNRILLKETLSKVSLEVITAANGHEGILLAIEYKPRLILLDIRMPLLNGFEALDFLKKVEDTAHIPIIAMTAAPTREEKASVLEYGFDGYVAKPIHFDRLISEIAPHLAYTVKEKKPAGVPAPHGLLNVTPDQPDVLCRHLKDDVLPRFYTLKKVFTANEFKQLGESLDQLGRQFHIEPLSRYGSHMLALLSAFDIKQMDECLAGYSQMIETFIRNLETSDG